MNTFLVSNDFTICAKVLDPNRLNRQITECCQLARILKCIDILKPVPMGIQFPLATKLWISAYEYSVCFPCRVNTATNLPGIVPGQSITFSYSNMEIKGKQCYCTKIDQRGRGKILIPELHQFYKACVKEWEEITGKPHSTQMTFNWGSFVDRKPLQCEWSKETLFGMANALLNKDRSYYERQFSRLGIVSGDSNGKWIGPTVR